KRVNQDRKEYNHNLTKKIRKRNNDIERHKYITITIEAKNYNRALMILARNEGNLMQGFQNLGTELEPLDLEERLALYEEIYRNEITREFDLTETKKQGIRTKDKIATTSSEYKRNQGMIRDEHFRSTVL